MYTEHIEIDRCSLRKMDNFAEWVLMNLYRGQESRVRGDDESFSCSIVPLHIRYKIHTHLQYVGFSYQPLHFLRQDMSILNRSD